MNARAANGFVAPVSAAVATPVVSAPMAACLPRPDKCNISIKPLSGVHRKLLFALQENIAYMGRKYGINNLIFGTITLAPKIYYIKEAQRLFNSFANWMRQRLPNAIIGVHRAKDGSIHLHFVAGAPVDVRTGFDHDAVKRRDYSSVCPWLRDEWAEWRKVTNHNGLRDGLHLDGRGRTIEAAAYPGIGRCELAPIRTTPEQVALYLADNIAKGLEVRREEDKGARLIRYWGDSRCVWQNFSWVGPRSWLFRAKVRQWALVEEACSSPEALREKHGPRWCYHNRENIEKQQLTVYATAGHLRNDGHELLTEVPDYAGPIVLMPAGCDLKRLCCHEDTSPTLQPFLRAHSI